MIALAALAAVAGEPMAMLRPVLDSPYRLTVSEERNVSGRLHHFASERRVVFRRDGDGLVAEVTLLRLTHDVGERAGRRFLAAAGALKGRVVRFRLDADGSLRSIDDEAALWDATVAALGRAGGRPGATEAAPPATAMAALPAEARRATLASILMPAIAGADAARLPVSHPVSVPSRLLAAGTPLTGTETVSVGADRLVRIVTHASAGVDGHAVSLDRERSIDAAHGLVVRQEEVQTIRLGDAVQVTRKQTVLVPPVR